jgi:uncharacterized protein
MGRYFSRVPSFLSPVLRSPTTRFELVNGRTGRVFVSQLEVAVDSATRNKGLLGRDGLEAGRGLVIAPTNAVHTFFMRFAIDVVFVARDGRVVKIRHAVPARRITAAFRAFAVIELPAGTAATELAQGDQVVLRERAS